MFVSQPTLSRQIAMLEQELKIRLFERSNNVLKLSPAGEFFAVRARELLDQVQDTVHQLDSFSSSAENCLRIGLLEDQQLTPRLTQGLRDLILSCTGISVEISRGNFSDLVEHMNQGMLDLCQLLLYEDIPNESYDGLIFSSECPCLAVKRGLLPAHPGCISKSELHRLLGTIPLIAVSRRTYPEALQSHLPKLGKGGQIDEENQLYTDSLSTISLYVTSGLAASIVNAHSLLALEPDVELIEICDLLPINQGCMWLREEKRPVLDRLIAILRGACMT